MKTRNFFERSERKDAKRVTSNTDSGYCNNIPRLKASVSLVTRKSSKTKSRSPSPDLEISHTEVNSNYDVEDGLEDSLVKDQLNNNMMEDSEMTAHFAASSLEADAEISAAFGKQHEDHFKIKLEPLVRKSRLGNVGWDVDRLTNEDGYINKVDWIKHQAAKRPEAAKLSKKEKPTLGELVNRQRHADRLRQMQVQSRTEHAIRSNQLVLQAKVKQEEQDNSKKNNILRNIDRKQRQKEINDNIQQQIQNQWVHQRDQKMTLVKERKLALMLAQNSTVAPPPRKINQENYIEDTYQVKTETTKLKQQSPDCDLFLQFIL